MGCIYQSIGRATIGLSPLTPVQRVPLLDQEPSGKTRSRGDTIYVSSGMYNVQEEQVGAKDAHVPLLIGSQLRECFTMT